MKKLSKILSVGLSLAMCASMVAPAFAASFGDLQAAIDAGATPYHQETGYLIDEATGRYGYGDALNEDNTQFEIEAWNDGDTRRVELNANVEFEKNGDDKDRDNGIIVWRSDKDVVIELNGHDIDMNPDAELVIEEYDDEGHYYSYFDGDANVGTVIRVTGGADVTITDSSAETYVDEEGETHYVAGTGTGKITGGNAWGQDGYNGGVSYENGVGAVYVNDNSSFTMEGGSVSGNLSYGPAICAENTNSAKNTSDLDVTLKGVTVEDNYTAQGGTIYFRAHKGTVNATIEDCVITGNVAEGDAIDFGIYGKGQGLTATITDTTITGNRVDQYDKREYDHGGVALWQGDGKDLNVTFDGCVIQDNEGGCTGIYYDKRGEDGLTIMDGTNTICGNGRVDEDGVCKTPGTSVTYQDGTTEGALHTDAYWEALDGEVEEATCMAEGSISYVCPFCKNPHTVETEINPDNHSMGEWYVSKQPGPGVAGEERSDCVRGCGHYETRPLDPLPVPDDSTVEIDEVDVPLAGLFTRADAIGYLWKQAGSPEWELSEFLDVPEDHQWAVAIGWAEDMGIAVADEDGNFRPDDLILRYVEDLEIDPEGEFEEFLNRYAVYAGIKLDEGELFYKLGGAANDIVMGEEAQEIFNSFFAKLEAALGQAA